MNTYINVCCEFYIHAYIHTCLLLLSLMLWHRRAIFGLIGDKLSSSAECRKYEPPKSPADWMPTHKPTELSRIQQKCELNSPRPYHEWEFSPLDFTADWLSRLALAIYMFVVVKFDALAQASDFRMERRHDVFLWWMRDLELGSLGHQIALLYGHGLFFHIFFSLVTNNLR